MRALGVTLVLVACLGLGSAQVASQPDPCQSKFRVVADETHCDRYWECVNGQPQLYDCPNGLVFVGRNRGIAEGCDYPWRTHTCGNKALANAPIQTEHCEWLYGIFGHETSCTRYWTCWNGTATEQFCIGGLLYSEETHACDWPQNVGGCQKHPLCKDDPNANVPLGKSCERYWACQGGYPRLQRCPATLVFDRASRRCVNPPTVDCDVPPTPPPQKRQQQARQGGGQNQARQGGGQNQARQGGGQQRFQGGGQQQRFQGGQQQQQQQQEERFQDQSASPQRPRVQQRRPQLSARDQQQEQQQPRQQEQELPPQEQIVEQPLINEPTFQEDLILEEPIQANPLPQRPRGGNQLPFIPAGATPINLRGGSNLRLPPIPGAIPIRFN